MIDLGPLSVTYAGYETGLKAADLDWVGAKRWELAAMTIPRDRLYQIHDLLGSEGLEVLARMIDYAGQHADEHDLTIAGVDAIYADIGLVAAILQPWNFNEDGSDKPMDSDFTRSDPRTPGRG